MSTHGELRVLSVVSPKDEAYEVKILEWRRSLLLSQSAPYGRLDCNESKQSKRDLLATAGEPALATLPGSPKRNTSSLRVRAARRRTVWYRVGGDIQSVT